MVRRDWLLALATCAALAACFERGSGKAGRAAVDDAAAPSPPISITAVTGPHEPAGPRDTGATIRIALEAEPAQLNPLVAGDAITQRVALGDIYEGLLCRRGATSNTTPCLAESVTVGASGKRWTFRLRAGVRWHDGAPFTARDVTFTYDLLRARKVASWLASDVDDLVRVETSADARVVRLYFRSSRPGRRNALARIPILPAHVWERVAPARFRRAAVNRAPIGTGPLRFVAWKAGQSIELERWDGYWGKAAAAARIAYRIVPDRNRTINLLEASELDVAVQLPIDDALRVAARRSDLAAFSYQTPAYLAAVYNLRNPALADVRSRRALTMLLDRGGVVDELFRGLARIVTGPLMLGSEGADPTIRPLPFAPKQAARLLAASGARGTQLELMVPGGSRTMARIADVWAEDARPYMGLTVTAVPFIDMLARLRAGRFDIALMAFTTSRDVDLFTRFHSSQVGIENYGAVRDETLDRALVAVRAAASPAARAAAQRAVHARLHALQPYTFIASDTRAGVARRDIGGLGASGGAMPRARDLWKQR